MKTVIVLLFISLSLYSQEKKVEIYEYKNGIKNISPTQIVIKKENKTIEVYNVKQGIQEVNPVQIIEGKEVYSVVNGIKEIIPSFFIEEPIIKED